MDIMQDGVEVYCLPDTARCTLANKSQFDIDNCPDGNVFCTGDCFYYTEEKEK